MQGCISLFKRQILSHWIIVIDWIRDIQHLFITQCKSQILTSHSSPLYSQHVWYKDFTTSKESLLCSVNMSPPVLFTHFSVISRFLETRWQCSYIWIYKNKVREISPRCLREKSSVSFFLQQTNTFAISNHDGKITVSGPLDFEKVQRYTLFVTAKVFTKIQLLCFTINFAIFKNCQSLQYLKAAL